MYYALIDSHIIYCIEAWAHQVNVGFFHTETLFKLLHIYMSKSCIFECFLDCLQGITWFEPSKDMFYFQL